MENEAAQLQVVVDINKEVFSSIAGMLDACRGRRELCKERRGSIFKVGEEIRKEDPGAYEPQIVSIGPFHRGKSKLLPMEEIKLQYLDSLINRHSSNTLHKYIDAVSDPSFLQKITEYYSEQVIGDDGGKIFVETMVLDGCFVIEFLVRLLYGESMGELGFFNEKISLVLSDLLLIENQIPFLVLECLFDLSSIPQLGTVTGLALRVLQSNTPNYYPQSMHRVAHHLLHLQHSSFSSDSGSNMSEASQVRPVTRKSIRKLKSKMSQYVFWLLAVLITCRRPRKHKQGTPTPWRLPSAIKLYRAGVTFKPKYRSSLLDVTFRAVDGVMEIPLLSVSLISMSNLKNLVTIEQNDPSVGNQLTSFAVLMHNLIETTADVELLVRSEVLESKLDGNIKVKRFFNTLGKGAYVDHNNHYLKTLYHDVTEYCAEEKHEWRASLMHTYFRSPWTTISLLAAAVLLVLTLLQTFFAVFAYFNPP